VKRKALLVLVLVVLSAACATLHYGRMPETRLLVQDLTPQVSTKADVLRVLGSPRGYGKARLAEVSGPRTIWYYEETDASAAKIKLGMLLVFFDGELFDGYMWFSSLEKWSAKADGP